MENIVEKGEIAQNEQFHLFPQCFCKVFLFNMLKQVYTEESIKTCPLFPCVLKILYKPILAAKTTFVIVIVSFAPHLGGSVVSTSDSWPGGCEFDLRLRRIFLSSVFSPLNPAEACEKSSRWLWKEKLC